jgi:hypothetical protein
VSVAFDQLHEGDTVIQLDLRPDLAQVIRFCGLSWVFPPLFYDIEAARAQGMPGTILPGPFKLGLIYRAVDGWLGDAGFIRHVRAAHRRPDLTGRPITVAGTIARLYEEDGRRRADLEVVVLNEQQQPSVRGFASVEFSS